MYRQKSVVILVLALFAGLTLGADNPSESQYLLGVSAYYANHLDTAESHFRAVSDSQPDLVDNLCYLAETSRRLKKPEAAIQYAQRALNIDKCNSFALTTIAESYQPMFGKWEAASSDSVWHYARLAVNCDSTDGNPWLTIWTEAIRRGEKEWESRAMQALARESFFSPAVVAYNRWVLENLPPDAILFTNGDLDTYPAVMLQQANEIRPDVAVVNLSLLNTPWYAGYINTRYGVMLPVPQDEIGAMRPERGEGDEIVTVARQLVNSWMKRVESGELRRPLMCAVTAYGPNLPADFRKRSHFGGVAFRFDGKLAETDNELPQMMSALDKFQTVDLLGKRASEADRSPIRRMTNDFPTANQFALAIQVCHGLLEKDDVAGAKKYYEWARELTVKTGTSDRFGSQLTEMEKLISEHKTLDK